MNEIFIGAFWLAFYILHSTLATSFIKRFIKKVFPVVYPHYRALYSTIAVVNFILLIGLHVRLASPMLFYSGPWLKVAAAVFGVSGMAIILGATRSYQWTFFWANEEQSVNTQGLITTGMNAHVRHPIYFGILLVMVGLVCVLPSAKNLVFAVISVGYIIVGATLEERKLHEQYGAQYSDYASRVKMLLPYLL